MEETMTRPSTTRIRALFLSRSIRIALVTPIAALALLASQGGLQPSGVAAYSGCTTVVFEGKQRSAVLINPPFTVTGTVDATGCGVGVLYYGGHTGKISGATIFGASDETASNRGDGDGILLYDPGTSVTVLNSTVRDNNDAGVDLNNYSNLAMTGSKVNHNGGRGFDISSGATATINTTFITNTTTSGFEGDGDGVHLDGSGLVKIISSNISNNDDAAIDDFFDSSLFMNSDNLNGNGGYGVSIGDGATATINNSIISGTTDSGEEGDGDGIEAENGAGDITIANTRVAGNQDDGLDLEDSPSSTIVMKADTVNNNRGAGLYLYRTSANVTASLFLRNGANRAGYAHGIDLEYRASATLTDTFVESNVQDGVLIDDSSASLMMTHSFVLVNNVGVYNDGGTLVANRSVLCKNAVADLINTGPYLYANQGSTVCHSI
jgi:hypothetical protein